MLGRGWMIFLSALCVGLAASGCSFLGVGSVSVPDPPRIDWSRFMPAGDEEPPKPAMVVLDGWQKDSLHCAARHCSNLYELVIEQPGEVKVELYAPLGRLPDFGAVLLDANAGVLARSQEPGVRPRRLQARVERGSYVIHVYALGVRDPSLSYEVNARLTAAAPPARPAPPARTATTPARPSPAPEPTPTPAPQPAPPRPQATGGGVQADVLDVEERGGATFVLLDAGGPQSVAVGMRGRLLEDDAILAEIEVVEVFPDGSRARILGELSGSISIDTKARIDTRPMR